MRDRQFTFLTGTQSFGPQESEPIIEEPPVTVNQDQSERQCPFVAEGEIEEPAEVGQSSLPVPSMIKYAMVDGTGGYGIEDSSSSIGSSNCRLAS